MQKITVALTRTVAVYLLLIALIIFAPAAKAASEKIYSEESDGYVDSAGKVFESSLQQMTVGDWDTNGYARGFVKFGLSGIWGTLSSARLYLYVYNSSRDDVQDTTSPLSNPGLGDCQVIHIADYVTLDASDFAAASIANDPGTLIPGAGAGSNPNIGYVSVDVRAAMQDDISNSRPFSAFMIRLGTDTDHSSDYDYWAFRTSEQTGTDKDPYIEYEVGPTTTTTGTTTATSTTTTTTTTTSTSTSQSVTVTTSTVVGTLTSYYFTVSTPTTIYVFITSSSTTSTTTTLTSTSTSITVTTSTATTTLTTSTTAAGRCVIAGAAYGSDLAPPVQFLREFRDGKLLPTFAGGEFMKAFNSFYYSFSPTAASVVAWSPALSQLVRLSISPLIFALQASSVVFGLLSFAPELAAIVSGTFASAFVGTVYLTPLILIERSAKIGRKHVGIRLQRLLDRMKSST